MPTSSAREIHIAFDQRVPMRDGITLSADIYLPIDSSNTSRKYPVILTRTPYMKLSEAMSLLLRMYEVVVIPMVHLCRISTRDRMVMTPLNGVLLSHGRMEMLAL